MDSGGQWARDPLANEWEKSTIESIPAAGISKLYFLIKELRLG